MSSNGIYAGGAGPAHPLAEAWARYLQWLFMVGLSSLAAGQGDAAAWQAWREMSTDPTRPLCPHIRRESRRAIREIQLLLEKR